MAAISAAQSDPVPDRRTTTRARAVDRCGPPTPRPYKSGQDAVRGETGVVEFVSSLGKESLGGFAPAPVPGWAVDVRQDTAEAFAPIDDQRNLAILIALVGSLLVGAFAVWFANRTTHWFPAEETAIGALRTREQN